MLKPKLCPMHVECCEQCQNWEPIPFHDDGGVCLARGEMSMRRLSTPDFPDRSAKVPPKTRESLSGPHRILLSKLQNTASFVQPSSQD